ncbi:MAG: hypothetical protein ACREPE_11565 [Lysobacter sp.]
MKTNNVLMLTFAISTTLFITSCNRDRVETPATDTVATEQAPAVAPAPTPAPVPAPPAPADSGLPFADMDKNSDGSLAREEMTDTEMLHQHFDQADTDHDGKLSKAEVDKHRADMAATPADL